MGCVGSVISTNAVLELMPIMAYSRPVSGSVQPQTSFQDSASKPEVFRSKIEIASIFLHGKPSAIPAVHTPALRETEKRRLLKTNAYILK